MKSFALLVLVFGACAAQQQFSAQRSGNDIVITRSESEDNGNGNFRWLYETSDGSQQEATGEGRPTNDPENPILQSIRGSFSYVSPEGQQINVRYIADENGFQPEGEHLPTPPPVPEAIQKALELIYRNADSQSQGPSGPGPAARPAPRPSQPRPQQPRGRF